MTGEIAGKASDFSKSCKSNLAATVLWDIVRNAICNENSSNSSSDRIIFMLSDLKPELLRAIASNVPSRIDGRKVNLKINRYAAEELVSVLDDSILTDLTAVEIRNTGDGIVVFAPSEEEKEGNGASLKDIARIDEYGIIANTDKWLEILKETHGPEAYLKNALIGLMESEIFLDLDMWVDFICSLKSQGFSSSVDNRIKQAMPSLRIPLNGIMKLPVYKENKNPAVRDFNMAFRDARQNAGVYVTLMNPKQERVDIEEVRDKIDSFPHKGDEETLSALSIARELIEDAENIRPNDWRDSQRNFCEKVSWEEVGINIFDGGKKVNSQNLGEQTLEFIAGNYSNDVSDEDRALLNFLPNTAPKEPREEEVEFFYRWQERLNNPKSMPLFKKWQKRLFSREVIGHDLISAFAEGFEALIVAAGDVVDSFEKPHVLIRTTHHDKEMYWDDVDKEVLHLFRFELNCVRKLAEDRVTWDLDAAFRSSKNLESLTNEARKIDLELYLVEKSETADLGGLKKPSSKAPRVKVIWQPGMKKPKDEPISLSLANDLKELDKCMNRGKYVFQCLTYSPKSVGTDSGVSPVSLNDRNSFADVQEGHDGKTYDAGDNLTPNLFEEINKKMEALKDNKNISENDIEKLRTAISEFNAKFHAAIRKIVNDPVEAFCSDEIANQAEAFGDLCKAGRLPVEAGNIGNEIRSLIGQIGIINSNDAEPMAIIPAWHPLRLAERYGKIRELGAFLDQVLSSEKAMSEADLSIAFQGYRVARSRWVFPEVAYVGDKTLVSVEDLNGYSLMAPASKIANNQEALEASAQSAASEFIKCVDRYLDIYPHEETNLSAGIIDSESLSLPGKIAREMAQRLHGKPNLRCDLVITHSDQERMRTIYKNQNIRLGAENISATAKGFLSRLRVDVKPNSTFGSPDDDVPDLDMVFLHDVIGRLAIPEWELEPGSSDGLEHNFDMSLAQRTRRRIGHENTSIGGIYLTLPQPPRAVARYQDMIYEISRRAFLPTDSHAVLVRQINSSNDIVRKLIEKAHNLAEWVVSFDKVTSKALLRHCGVKIINDISLPGSEERVIISSRRHDSRLTGNIENDIKKACNVDAGIAKNYAGKIVNDILKVSGQKILSAACYENRSKELIGLGIMRAWMESTIKSATTGKPFWISLDDFRNWFMSEKGHVADAVAISIEDSGSDFQIFMHVGEAKFVEKALEHEKQNEAERQVIASVERFTRLFIDNEEDISRTAACARLAELLVNLEGVNERFANSVRRTKFFDDLYSGNVNFHICGEAVICIHDNHDLQLEIKSNDEMDHIRSAILTKHQIQHVLKRLANNEVPDCENMEKLKWHSGNAGQDDKIVGPARDNDLGRKKENSALGDAIKYRDIGDASVSCEKSENQVHEHAKAAEDRPKVENNSRIVKESPQLFPVPMAKILWNMVENEHGAIDDSISRKWAEEKSQEVQRALSHFGMKAEFSDPKFRLTPNGALVSFKGNSTLTTTTIEKRKSEFLTTYGIDVLDIRPGLGKISIFIRREKRAKVPLASTLLKGSWPDRNPGVCTSFLIGAREDDDRMLYLNLTEPNAGYERHGPHTLIAGETGSGKGILIQCLLLQLIAFNNPKTAELILVDPKKGVDFYWLKNAPHMQSPIITEIDDAVKLFQELVSKMDERYKLLESRNVSNIDQYNEKAGSSGQMSRIFVVHDELGAWMAQNNDYQKEVLSTVSNLGMKARAAGIHLILITQRADADAVPTRLRDNMGNRFCLKVQNSTGSKMVLGMGGAEKLLGKGHLACICSNEPMPSGQEFFVVQVPFAEPEDMNLLAEAAIKYWSDHRIG